MKRFLNSDFLVNSEKKARMRKGIFWIGVIIFILAAALFFLSGSTSGSSPETAKPTIPLIYGTNQGYWMLLGLAGVIIIIAGALLKNKK